MRKIKSLLIFIISALLLSQACFAIPSLMVGGYSNTPQMQYAKLQELSDIIRSSHYMSGFNDTPLRNAYELYTQNDSDLSEVELRNEMLKLLEDEYFYKYFANLMLQQYDRNSYLLDEETYMNAYQMDHNYDGYGFNIADFGPFFIIKMIYPESEAEKSGLIEGDIVVKVNSVDVRCMEFEELNALISDTSDKGEAIELTCFNADSPELRKVRINISKVNIPDVECEIYNHETAIITINMFNSVRFYSEMEDAVNKIKENDIKNIILDLRDNPGGYVNYCLTVINYFIDDDGVMLMSEATRAKTTTHYSTGNGRSFENVYVLVNENSASSAEILAASLRDNINATLIGTTTYGKCFGQMTIPFYDDDFLVLTTSEAVLPKTENYDHKGLEPDILLENETIYYEIPDLTPLDIDEKITPKSSETQIIALEERLSLLKYLHDEPDGVYDDETIAAVNAFQNQMGLWMTSNCSTELLELLDSAVAQLSDAELIYDSQMEYVLSLINTKEDLAA